MTRSNLLSALLVFGLMTISACVDGKTHKYPTAVVDNVVSSCMKSGETKELCTCATEKIQAKYTYDEFVDLDKRMEKGERPQEFTDFAIAAKAECGRK
jgi:hypothetical protein